MPKVPKLSLYKQHVQRWKSCTACKLCETRKKVVMYRGDVPCDILFIGEAPGPSEDVIGQPFIGPAGHLLDRIIDKAIQPYRKVNPNISFRKVFTNLVCFIPKAEE